MDLKQKPAKARQASGPLPRLRAGEETEMLSSSGHLPSQPNAPPHLWPGGHYSTLFARETHIFPIMPLTS